MKLMECDTCGISFDFLWQRCDCAPGEEALQAITPLGVIPLPAPQSEAERSAA